MKPGNDHAFDLTSWQAIADHLGVSVRNAQYWKKKHGLPVRRLSPGSKGRVCASKAELDEWQRQNRAAFPEAVPARLPWLICALAGLAVPLVFLGGVLFGRRSDPAALAVDGEYLVANDQQGHEVWRTRMPWPPEGALYARSGLATQRRFQFVDLTGDGQNELLAQYAPEGYQTRGHFLYAIGSKGQVLWKFKPGREIVDGRTTFSPFFGLNSFAVVDLKGGKELWVALTGSHLMYYPNHVAVLDAKGNLRGEYFHSGHLRHLLAEDLDQDGEPELILGGANVGRHQATLVVLDPRKVSGASVQPAGDPSAFKGFSKATEKVVVYFPRSCIGLHEDFDIVSQFRISENRISVVVQQGVNDRAPYYLIFELDWKLNLLGVVPSDTYAARHRELEAQGLLKHAYSVAEIDLLRSQYVVRQ